MMIFLTILPLIKRKMEEPKKFVQCTFVYYKTTVEVETDDKSS